MLARGHVNDGNPPVACHHQRRVFILRRHRQPWVENRRDVQSAQNIGGATDVIALRVREQDSGERPQAHATELNCNVGLRRPLVDKDRRPGRLDENAVTLADIEKRDA